MKSQGRHPDAPGLPGRCAGAAICFLTLLLLVPDGRAETAPEGSPQDLSSAGTGISTLELLLTSPETTPVSVDRIELRAAATGTSLTSLTPNILILLEPADSLFLVVHLSTIPIPLDTLNAEVPDLPDSSLSPDPADSSAAMGDTTISSPTDSLIAPDESQIDGTPTDDIPDAASFVIIDEILADPPAGIDGDANRDGERHTYHDEFVELFNTGSQPVSLAGWQLGDDDTDLSNWFIFPADAVIQPGERLLLFGGGAPTGFDVPVFVDDGRIGNGLTNGGDTILLIDAEGDTIDALFGANWKSDQSQVRASDGSFVRHTDASSQGLPFSPGRATDAVETDATPGDAPVDTTSGEQTETPLVSEPDAATAPDSLATSEPSTNPENASPDAATSDSTANADSLPDTLANGTLSNEETTLPDSLATAPPSSADSTLVDPPLLDTSPADSTAADSSMPDATFPDSTNTPVDSAAVATPAPADSLVVPDNPLPGAETTDTTTVTEPPLPSDQPPDSTESQPSVPDTSAATGTDSTHLAQTSSVVIDEILADPPAGIDGDANCDGERHTYHDEFVELLNTGSQSVALAGWKLGDDDAGIQTWFTFPADAVIPPGGRLLLFGGGAPTGFAVPVFIDDGRIGNGLTNGGDTILLTDAKGDTVYALFGDNWKSDQSQVRTADSTSVGHTDVFIGHTDASSQGLPFSPGRATDAVAANAPPDDAPADSTAGQQSEAPPVSEPDATTPPDSLESPQTSAETEDSPLDPAPPDSTTNSAGIPDTLFDTPADSTLSGEETALPDSIATTTADSTLSDTASADSTDDTTSLPNAAPDNSTDSTTPISADSLDAATPTPPDSTDAATPDSTDVADIPSVVIDEILADPPAGIDGDANRDGERHAYHDEFVELLNTGTHSISLADWKIGDDDTDLSNWFTFPADAIIPPGGRLLLFGGGAPTGFTIPVFVDDGRIGNGLTNGGDTILLIDATGDTVDILYGDSWESDQSQIRSPDGTFTGHTSLSSPETPFSPGTPAINADPSPKPGTPDSTGISLPSAEPIYQAQSDSAEYPPISVVRNSLIITEILADPPAGPPGDANHDGVTDPYEDEFIELHNLGPPLDLSGWHLSDDDTRFESQFRFPPGTIIDTGQYLVLFGGGVPIDIPAPAFTDDGRIGNGLTNTGDRILLIPPTLADTAITLDFTEDGGGNHSLSRTEDGRYAPHDQLPGRLLFSPGRNRPLYTHFTLDSLILTLGQPPVSLPLCGHHPDGQDTVAADELLWASFDKEILQFDADGRALPLHPGDASVIAGISGHTFATGLIRVRHPEPPPNQPPRITSIPDTTVYVGGRYHYQVRALDPENNSLVYALLQVPSWLELSSLTGLLSGRAPPEAVGSAAVSFQVADGQGGLDIQQYSLQILPRPAIRISELLADPPPGPAGDANGDGIRQTYADEFVEIHNYGDRAIDLSGWRLSDDDADDDAQFHFPTATLLTPGTRAVLFGGGLPRGDHFFTDDGRIGNGLDNRTEQIYLIDPQGPDTLTRAFYHLDRAPDQALVWDSNAGHPLLHAQWPGRDPFSPGRPRPLLQSLQLIPPTLRLLVGESVTLQLMGLYSDGERRDLLQSPLWSSAQPHIATVAPEGEVTAADTGASTVTARLDTFATSARIDVRLPLLSRLRFTPTWERISLPAGRQLLFAARPVGTEMLSYHWSLNGHPQATTASQLVHASSPLPADTVAVQIHSRRETITRQWIISTNRPPIAEPPIDSLAILGQTFSLAIRASDPDGDVLLFLPERTPPGGHLHPGSGNLTWTPPDTGRFPFHIQISDGYHLLPWQCDLRVLPPTAKPSSTPRQLSTSSHPNPFSSAVTITFRQPAEQPLPVAVHIYDITGQQVRTLIDASLPSDPHTVRWNGTDRRGRPVAAGVYLYRVECGNHRTGGKLLFLP
jgi:hypothetical protein